MDVVATDYLKCVLVLDMIDPQDGHLIRRGWATSQPDSDPDPEKIQPYVDTAVRKILDEFSPEV